MTGSGSRPRPIGVSNPIIADSALIATFRMQVVGEEQDQMIPGVTGLGATRASIIFLRIGQPIQRFQVDQWKYLMASDDLSVTIKRSGGCSFC
jgi:hypothetical protein